MKKNKFMRLASVMLMLCLITTCAISGTFAKYTTSDSAKDSARVAKWGIVLTVSDSDGSTLFAKDYEDEDDSSKMTVSSLVDLDLVGGLDDVVAPGTASTGITFTINGTPEVATQVTASLGETKDVFIKYDSDSNGSLDATYYPVVFTLTHTYGAGAQSIKGAADAVSVTCTNDGSTDVVTGTLADIQKVLVKLSELMTKNAPGYVYNDTFKLTWAWAFEHGSNPTEKELFNGLDTQLGNLMAGTVTAADGTYCLDLAFNFSITVEQVD